MFQTWRPNLVGRKSYYKQIAMSALGIVPPRLWNERGDKINIDNNRISVLVKESGIEVRTVREALLLS